MERSELNLLKYRRQLGVLSILMVVASLALLITRGLNLGLDFTGGTLIEASAPAEIVLEDARAALADTPFDDAVLQHFGTASDLLVRVAPKEGIDADQAGRTVFATLEQAIPGLELRRVEFVGPQVGDELRDQSGLAILMAMGAMLVYVWFRFSNKLGVAAVVALLHDVIVVLGFFALFQWQVDLTVLAALLALVGYSINDSIVIADYVREYFRTTLLTDPERVVNKAVLDTLSRTLVTSMTTWVVVLVLQIFGGEAVHGFALALSIGIIVGTYSSIFIVCNVALGMKMTREDFLVPQPDELDQQP